MSVLVRSVDLVSFGRAFLANPYFVARLRQEAPLNQMMDASTIYGGGAHGYVCPVEAPMSEAAATTTLLGVASSPA